MSIAEWLSTPHAVTLAGWVWLIVAGILAGGIAALFFALSFIQSVIEGVVGVFNR